MRAGAVSLSGVGWGKILSTFSICLSRTSAGGMPVVPNTSGRGEATLLVNGPAYLEELLRRALQRDVVLL